MIKLRKSTSLLKWSSPGPKMSRGHQLTPSGHDNNGNNKSNNPTPKRWIHDDSLLVIGHVAYLVKYLGHVEVDQPKGLDVVRKSIKMLEFQEHLRRSEGEKIKRIELTISIGGVAIREPKTKKNLHQFPLHRISYCADDKSERKYLSFISKVQDSSDRHECFVFVSGKLSEEIALTIGQAFDLAWRKFLDASGHDFDARRELVQAKMRIQELEHKVDELESKLKLQSENSNMPNHDNVTSQSNIHTPPVSPTTTNPTIDLSLATSRLQSLIDLP